MIIQTDLIKWIIWIDMGVIIDVMTDRIPIGPSIYCRPKIFPAIKIHINWQHKSMVCLYAQYDVIIYMNPKIAKLVHIFDKELDIN